MRLERAESRSAALCDGGDVGWGRRLVAAVLWGLRARLALGCVMQGEGCGAGCGMLPGKEEEGRGRAECGWSRVVFLLLFHFRLQLFTQNKSYFALNFISKMYR